MNIIPYRIRKLFFKQAKKTSGWFGSYPSWNEVSKLCQGYNENSILEKVKNATLEVKNGNAVFERDSVLFYKEEYNDYFLETLNEIASECNNQLKVLDFGGALGSVYFQYLKKIKDYNVMRWCIVEQSHYVDFGKKELENEHLKFYYTIEECTKNEQIDVVLLSSVISYLEKPYNTLEQIMKLKVKYIIIDRNIFTNYKDDILCRQIVPETIYKASYPCWVLNKNKLITFMLNHYVLTKEFDPYNNELVEIENKTAYFRALVFKRI